MGKAENGGRSRNCRVIPIGKLALVSNWEHSSIILYVRLTDAGEYGHVLRISKYTK